MGAEVASSASSETPRRRSNGLGSRVAVMPASAGDHAAIFHFLTAVGQGPSRAEFKASLEDPFYEPYDRLIVRRKGRIVGHVHLTHRAMHFGPATIPVAQLDWLATLPEYRNQGIGSRLLVAAERHMAKTGALVGLLRTTAPLFFRRTGWALCGQHGFCRADARAVLSSLLDRSSPRRRQRYQIRPWRRWEQAALARIYHHNVHNAHGPLQRTDAYWQWLIRRQAYGQIHVALDGPGLMELDEVNTRIVGYSVTRGERILEVFADSRRSRALAELLSRACSDAIEHDRQTVVLHASSDSPLHAVFRASGGSRHDQRADRGEVFMARLLDPVGLLRLFGGELIRRADEADLPRPVELGFLADGKKVLLELNRRDVRAESGRLGRSYVQLNVADFTRMVLGQLDWAGAIAEGRVEFSTGLARAAAPVLFPQLPLWRPPLDVLPA